ncbi:MAG: GNAT family N-acetyltransferase [Acidimicrobiales bacterium]
MNALRLREPNSDDEAGVLEAHQQMLTEGFSFATGLQENESWTQYVNRLDFYRYGDAGQWVPSTFLVAEVDGTIVGRSSIRFELDSLLAHEGGHIGYGVVPSERRKGHATEILTQSLAITRGAGLQRVLLTCTSDNEGSARVIQRCGGVFESEVEAANGTFVRRFWIE